MATGELSLQQDLIQEHSTADESKLVEEPLETVR
jgi:hypothetical protein